MTMPSARSPIEYLSYQLATVALVAMLFYAAGARAEDPGTPTFSFSGFGTAGLVHSSEDQADYADSVIKPNGVGHSRNWSADVDSRIGAQVTANFTRRISAVVQVISEQRYDNSYTPTVEWANIKYAFTPDISIRAGRIMLPVFLVSDYRKVGYANPWVRPPVELYSLIPISSNDGVDAIYRVYVGKFAHTVQGAYGESEFKLPAGGTAKAKHISGISYTGEYGAATVHATYYKANLTLESFKPLFDGFRQFGPEGIALADKYDTINKAFTFIGLGGMYDPGGWFVMGEWGATDSHSVLGKKSAWYGSGGYRIGKFTPYLTYALAKVNSNTSDPGLTNPFAAGLNAGLNATLGSAPVQKTISVGGRWDFTKNADLKLQFDHTRLGAGSPGTLINIQPGFQRGGKFNVFSATVDFVF